MTKSEAYRAMRRETRVVALAPVERFSTAIHDDELRRILERFSPAELWRWRAIGGERVRKRRGERKFGCRITERDD